MRWFGLDGVEHTGGPLVDFDGYGHVDDRLIDSDGDGLADRVLCAGDEGVTAYVDTDGDGHWDVRLRDADGDGAADGASPCELTGTRTAVSLARNCQAKPASMLSERGGDVR
ncbi:hypothetical protein NIIDMKKI_76980 [Mycobacterium kansasii]|uniref:Pullulanase n=1 Tax=Mycobacterium kansasii TaxID=1768 RepID=A0A7G1IQL7_MYCKA|nr:hypothetical protein NIIDMKKI_76980 [Mycobacterium kansasii]